MNVQQLFRTAAVSLACLLPFAGTHAETIQCTQIVALPYVINAPGVYCLAGDLSSGAAAGNAIDIQASYVVLDLNGHKLDGSAAGAATNAVGVHAADQRDITIKNGTIRGFHYGINLVDTSLNYVNSTAHVIEGIRADGNTYTAFFVLGSGNIIRNNHVYGTKGVNTTAGMLVYGPGAHVLNNDIVGTSAGAGFAYGLYMLFGSSAVIEGNRISATTCTDCGALGIYGSSMYGASIIGNRINNLATYANSTGIKLASGSRLIVSENRVSAFENGISMPAAPSGTYMGNLVVSATTPYSGGAAAPGTNF